MKARCHHNVGLGETPRRYFSLKKVEDAFVAAVHLSFAASRTIFELAFFCISDRFAHFCVVFNSILHVGAGYAILASLWDRLYSTNL